MKKVALRKESVDRNNTRCREIFGHYESLSARRAWIEIIHTAPKGGDNAVALRKESVDRNMWWGVRKAVGSLVALRKESVDRNAHGAQTIKSGVVALRKESVDRNSFSRLDFEY